MLTYCITYIYIVKRSLNVNYKLFLILILDEKQVQIYIYLNLQCTLSHRKNDSQHIFQLALNAAAALMLLNEEISCFIYDHQWYFKSESFDINTFLISSRGLK